MISLKSSPVLLLTSAIVLFVLFITLHSEAAPASWSLSRPSSDPGKKPPNHVSMTANRYKLDTTSEIGRASNATLGFEKVYVLGLKERSDKRDAIAVAASLTGFRVEFFDGVRGDDVPDNAHPPGNHLKGGEMGCWRGHMNIIRSVIEHNLASVFVFEDDADWDVRLLLQMAEFAKGVRSLQGVTPTQKQHSPYGDDWDILWPGHCGDVLHERDDRKYVIENDETVAPKEHQPWLKALADYPEGTRLVRRAGAPICTFGYAVSYRGAQKLLMWLAVKGGDNFAIDNEMAFFCRDGFLDIQCYVVEPQIINHHRPAGSASKDSDIHSGNVDFIREKGTTEMIVLSTRLNLEQLILGSTEFVKQW